MKSFHNNLELKTRLLAEVKKHRQEDSLIKGYYGNYNGTYFRGCAVGCSINSLNRIHGTSNSTGDHEALAEALDIDVRLCYLQDTIFERLPVCEAMQWPLRFYQALPVGADTALVWPRFAHWLLVDPNYGLARFVEGPALEATNLVGEMYRRWIDGEKPSRTEWTKLLEKATASPWTRVWEEAVWEAVQTALDEWRWNAAAFPSAWTVVVGGGSEAWSKQADKLLEILASS